MVKDALRGYLALAGGLTEVTAARARAAAKSLVEQGEATAGQVGALAEDLLSTSRRNRESMILLVRHEVEQTVRRLGMAAANDVDTLTQRVRDLERTIRELKSGSTPARGGTGAAVAPAAKATTATKPQSAAKPTKATKTAKAAKATKATKATRATKATKA